MSKLTVLFDPESLSRHKVTLSSSGKIGLGIMGMKDFMDVDAIEYSDDVEMHDPEDVTIEKLKDLNEHDLEGSLVSFSKTTSDSAKAFKIHFAVLAEAKGDHYVTTFHRDYPYYQRDSTFISTMLDAYREKDFRTILSWRPHQSPKPGDTQKRANKAVMAMQYSVPYKGEVANLFAAFIQNHAKQANNKHQLYANVIPVIQSSGTGKSRMLTETGKTLFTLPFCARAKNAAGWPPGDHDMLAYILERPDDQFSIETHIVFIAFLAAIFAEMKRVLESFGPSDIDTLRQRWHTYMERLGESTNPNREDFYANMLKRTKRNELDIHKLKRPELPKYSDLQSENDRNKFFDNFTKLVNYLSRGFFLKNTVVALLEVIKENVLLIYMDEANTLHNRYWALQRVFWTVKEHGKLWFSFMGTNASLSEFVPAADDFLSARLASEMFLLMPPYTALGFDQNIINMDLSSHQTMGQIRSLERICAYGRPLWNANYVSAVSGVGSVDETTFFQDARMKLLCSDTFNGKDINQVFAILSNTVCLDLVLGNRKATKLANTSVAKHMRLLIDVNDNRTFCFTQASSEPVLALVGAYIASKPNNLLDIIEGLTNNLCKDGLVDKGHHGELLARMILFIARIQSYSDPFLTPLSFATPVPVVNFLKTLFGEELWDKTPGRKCFEEALKGGYVNFHHFTLTRDEMPVKEDLNLEANLWARGTAVQCKFQQVDIDGHIPVYWGSIDEHEPFDPSNFSNLNYQVKFGKAGDTVSADRIQRPVSDRASKHPFIAVFLDMGSEQTYMSTGSRLSLETGAETLQRLRKPNSSQGQKTAKTAKKAIKALELDAKRYCINARGCDKNVFGVLKTMGIAEKWKKLVEITVETPTSEWDIVKTMQPLYRFDRASGYSDWMHDYSASYNQD